MTTSIPYDSSRHKVLKDIMHKQEVDAGGKESLPHAKIIIKGKSSYEPYYRIDINELAFNKANGRIKSEVIEKEAELGRILNHWNNEDKKYILEMLLNIRAEENEKIAEDLKINSQLYPGIITCDGIVINGNRRKAILHKIFDDTGNDNFKYLDVHVLPSHITKAELWLIEAGIQLSAPQQLDYSPINHLLKLREGVNAGLSVKEMASRIYGVTEKDIEDDLQRLDLIDDYLRDFLEKEGKYYLVRNLNEHFIDLQNILSWIKNPKGRVKRDWTPDESDVNELKLIGFYFIRIKYPHLRIRELRDLFLIQNSWQELKKSLKVDSKISDDLKETYGISTDSEKNEEDFDTTEEIKNPSEIEQKDLEEEAVWIEQNKPELKAYFQDAKEQEQIKKSEDEPLSLARKALKHLMGIPHDSKKISIPDIDIVLSEIIKVTNELRKLIHKTSK